MSPLLPPITLAGAPVTVDWCSGVAAYIGVFQLFQKPSLNSSLQRKNGSKEGRKASDGGQEEGGESCKSSLREDAEEIRNRWCTSAEEGSPQVCEMASSCEDSEEKDDIEVAVEGPASDSSVLQNIGLELRFSWLLYFKVFG